jgi:hypothetical protein
MNSAKTEVQGRHEWNKHGSATGLNMHEYFTKAITLATELASKGELKPGPSQCYDKSFNKITCPDSALVKYANEMQSRIGTTTANDKLWKQYWGII